MCSEMNSGSAQSVNHALACQPRQALKGFAQDVALLFAATEGASFISVLRRFLAGLVDHDDLTVFCQEDMEHPKLVWSSFEAGVIGTGVRNYVEATYVVDPFVRALHAGAPAGAYRAVDVVRHAGLTRQDRRSLPLRVRPEEELGFITNDWPEKRAELQILFSLEHNEGRDICCQVGLYRNPGRPTFSKKEAQFLTSVTPLVSGSFRQYWNRLARPDTSDGKPACLVLLSPRERSVIELVSQGFTSAAISALLQVSVETVKTHRKRAYRKLEISSQAELFALMQSTPTAIKYHPHGRDPSFHA